MCRLTVSDGYIAGQVLNCNVYDIATRAAVELEADKLIVMTTESLQVLPRALHNPPWMPFAAHHPNLNHQVFPCTVVDC